MLWQGPKMLKSLVPHPQMLERVVAQAAAPTVADDAAMAAFGMQQDAAQAAVQVVEQVLMVVEPGPASAQVWFAQAWCRA